MIVFDKLEIRQALTLDNIFDLLIEWGGDPEPPFVIIIQVKVAVNYIIMIIQDYLSVTLDAILLLIYLNCVLRL